MRELSTSAAVAEKPQASFIQRVSDFDLQGIVEYQRGERRKTPILGRCTNLRLGIDDSAAYFKGNAFRRLSATSKVMGLQLEWPEKQAPYVGFAQDGQSLIFLDGVRHRPKVRAVAFKCVDARSSKLPPGYRWNGSNLVQDDERGYIVQDFLDFSSGSLTGRDGSGFAVLQPIEQVIVLANVASTRFKSTGTMMKVFGHPTIDGRYPFLMIAPFKHSGVFEAYLAGGRFTFDPV